MLNLRFKPFTHLGELFHMEQGLLPDPRCRTFAAISVGIGAIGLGTTIASAVSGGPQYPNSAASSAQMADVEAQLLPMERQMAAEAQLGGTAVLPGYTQQTYSADQATQQQQQIQSQIDQLTQQMQAAQAAPGNNHNPGQQQASVAAIQSQITGLQSKLSAIPKGGGTVYMDGSGNIVPASQASQSFAGFSTADIQGQIEKELAQGQLTEAQKMDPQFIAEALAQEQQANPQGTAARAQLYQDIQNQINNPTTSPVSNEMEKQVEAKVNAGQGLTPDEQQMLAAAVSSGTADRGGSNPPADFSSDLTTGFQGEARGLANANAGTSWLASGETPSDIQYREEQQNLANLGNYISGATPQSQFKSLSGAQQGPTPVTNNASLPTLPGNAQELGTAGASAQYGAQIGAAQNTANPWMAGLSGVLGVGNTLGAAGWQPLSGGG